MAVCTVAVFVLFPTPTPHGVSKWNAGVLAELSPTEYRHLTPKESGVTSFLFGSFSGHRGMLDTWLCGGQEDTKASCLQTGRRHRSAGTDPGLGQTEGDYRARNLQNCGRDRDHFLSFTCF